MTTPETERAMARETLRRLTTGTPLSVDEIRALVAHSFLVRVPELMAADPALSLEDAIAKAREIDDEFCLRLLVADASRDEPAQALRRHITERVYQRLNAKGERRGAAGADVPPQEQP